jgi:PTS system mannose-specific IID component
MRTTDMNEPDAAGRQARWMWPLLLRSFLIQAVWNPRGMQDVGFFFAVSPLARTMKDEERRAFVKRHLAFFNTNPVLAPYVIGAVARAELEGRGEADADEIKRALSGVLGMAGDALMWGALRPAAGLIAAAVALYGLQTNAWNVWVAPIVMLVVYNVPHIVLRARGMARGLAAGPAAASELLGVGFRRTVLATRWVGAFAVGFVLALAVSGTHRFGLPAAVAIGAFLVLGAVAARLRIPATVVGVAGAAGGIILMVSGFYGG